MIWDLFSVCRQSPLRKLLRQPRRYAAKLGALQQKAEAGKMGFAEEQDGITLESMLLGVGGFSRAMARDVADGAYQLGLARARQIVVSGKSRTVFGFRLTDRVLNGVVADLILERMEPIFSPQLFSYRKGVNWWKGISAFSEYVRAYRAGCPDTKARGLYVFRRDVRKYTDSIPVGDRSALWPMLKNALNVQDSSDACDAAAWRLVTEVVRPEIEGEEGARYCRWKGVPTGSPISTTLFNVYLHGVDVAFDGVPGGFYARYADDILFAHPDRHVTEAVALKLGVELRALGLETNASKGENIYFTGAGRPCEKSAWRGGHVVDFLGCRVAFDGVVSLSASKVRALMRALFVRSRRMLACTRDRNFGDNARLVCQVMNSCLDPNGADAHKSARLLASAINDRGQLRELDLRIAKLAAELSTGIKGARAFRQLPYRELRTRWKLRSLYHHRNSA